MGTNLTVAVAAECRQPLLLSHSGVAAGTVLSPVQVWADPPPIHSAASSGDRLTDARLGQRNLGIGSKSHRRLYPYWPIANGGAYLNAAIKAWN
jgi:hypothetical protein